MRQRKRWSELSPAARTAIVVGGFAEAIVTAIALQDLVRRPRARCAAASSSGRSGASYSRSDRRSTSFSADAEPSADLSAPHGRQGHGCAASKVTVRSSQSFADTVTVIVPGAGRADDGERATVVRVVGRGAEGLLGARVAAPESLEHCGPVDRDGDRAVLADVHGCRRRRPARSRRTPGRGRWRRCDARSTCTSSSTGPLADASVHAAGLGAVAVGDRVELARRRTWSRTRRRKPSRSPTADRGRRTRR